MSKVFAVILSFNGKRDIIECLGSVSREQTEIIVVDNGSVDNSVQLIKSKFPKIRVIENKRNLGFAKGCNIGIRQALKKGAKAILLLNQDTSAKKDFLRSLLKNPADIVGPVIKFKRNKRWVYDLGGRINFSLGRTYHLEENKIRRINNIDYVSGCAVLIKRSVFEKIGYLDERFFLYFADVDFCLRAKKAGFKVAVEPKSIIIHKLTKEKKRPFKQLLHLLRSNLLFINRYVFFWKKPLAYFYWWCLLVKILLAKLI